MTTSFFDADIMRKKIDELIQDNDDMRMLIAHLETSTAVNSEKIYERIAVIGKNIADISQSINESAIRDNNYAEFQKLTLKLANREKLLNDILEEVERNHNKVSILEKATIWAICGIILTLLAIIGHILLEAITLTQ